MRPRLVKQWLIMAGAMRAGRRADEPSAGGGDTGMREVAAMLGWPQDDPRRRSMLPKPQV